jgi:uncharacterized protein YyaL (SSP411 family)
VIAGDADAEDMKAMLQSLNSLFLPNAVVVVRTKENTEIISKLAPYTRFHVSIDGKATAYVCRNFSCNLPTTDIKQMLKNLNAGS